MQNVFKRWLLLVAAVSLCSCATAPRVAPRFTAPSTRPIARAQAAIAQKQAETKGHIQKAQEIVRTLTIRLPEDKLKIDALSDQLNQALDSNDQLKAENDQLKGANEALTTEIGTQTVVANRLADNYDKAGAQITSIKESRHGWVKRFWIATGLLVGALVWIFRKPLLLMAGGIGI